MPITVTVAGQALFTGSTASTVRNVAQLIADVADFMTRSAGDVLTLGVPYGMPVAHAGDEALISIGAWPPLGVSFSSPTGPNGSTRQEGVQP